MNEPPTTYIREALSSLGIKCRTIELSHYGPTELGNLLAIAETSAGKLRIVYDRGFDVDAHQQLESADIGQITDALERYRVTATTS